MAHANADAWRSETTSQLRYPAGATRELGNDGVAPFSDDGLDFPPTLHPGRELFTFSIFVLMIVSLVIWGGWKLISLI